MNRRVLGVFTWSFIIFIVSSLMVAHAERLDQWQWSNPLPQGNTLNSVAHGNGVFVAVGLNGTIITSLDGYSWETRQTTTTFNLNNIAYVANIFIAVGQSGTILTSADGIHWVSERSGTIHDLQGVSYGNNRFVVVGSDGTLLTSQNGQDWTLQVSGTEYDLDCIAFGNGVFVVGGVDTLTSTDGILWVVKERLLNSSYYSLSTIIYQNDVFTAAGFFHCAGRCSGEPGTTILTSSDGIVWTTKASISGGALNELIYGNDTLVGVGSLGAGGSTFITFEDNAWEKDMCSSCGFGNSFKSISYANNTYVAVGDQGIILVSSDGVTWVDGDSRVLRRDARLNDIVYGDAGFVAVGGSWSTPSIIYEDLGPMEEGYTPVISSLDGLNWTAQNSGISYNTFNAVAFGNNTYVVVGRDGLILTSSDSTDWIPRSSGTELEINVLAYGNNTFVAVGNGRMALISPDGITWEKIVSENINIPNDMTYAAGLFIAVGDNGMIITSPDGIVWTERFSGTTNALNGISYGKNSFVTVGDQGVILTSPDGTVWAEINSGTTNELSGIDFGNHSFIAYGTTGVVVNLVNYVTEGIILTSDDGITWSIHDTPTNRICGVSSGEDTIVAIGCNAGLLQATGAEPSDAIWALQVLTGSPQTQQTYQYANSDGDSIVSLPDVIKILQSVKGSE